MSARREPYLEFGVTCAKGHRSYRRVFGVFPEQGELRCPRCDAPTRHRELGYPYRESRVEGER